MSAVDEILRAMSAVEERSLQPQHITINVELARELVDYIYPLPDPNDEMQKYLWQYAPERAHAHWHRVMDDRHHAQQELVENRGKSATLFGLSVTVLDDGPRCVVAA